MKSIIILAAKTRDSVQIWLLAQHVPQRLDQAVLCDICANTRLLHVLHLVAEPDNQVAQPLVAERTHQQRQRAVLLLVQAQPRLVARDAL